MSELRRRLASDEGVRDLAREMIGVLASQLPVLEGAGPSTYGRRPEPV